MTQEKLHSIFTLCPLIGVQQLMASAM